MTVTLRHKLLNRITKVSPWAIKKGATFIFTITLANVDRFHYLVKVKCSTVQRYIHVMYAVLAGLICTSNK